MLRVSQAVRKGTLSSEKKVNIRYKRYYVERFSASVNLAVSKLVKNVTLMCRFVRGHYLVHRMDQQFHLFNPL